jgi:RNA polymerase sigma-70 factor (ECF subfamily)
MDIHRRGRTTHAKDPLLADPHEADPTREAESALAQAEARRALWLLTTEQQQVILLKYFEGWTNEEVAAALDKPVGAVKSLQHRALDSLRRTLAPLRETTP